MKSHARWRDENTRHFQFQCVRLKRGLARAVSNNILFHPRTYRGSVRGQCLDHRNRIINHFNLAFLASSAGEGNERVFRMRGSSRT